jgi:hypothetical protein
MQASTVHAFPSSQDSMPSFSQIEFTQRSPIVQTSPSSQGVLLASGE